MFFCVLNNLKKFFAFIFMLNRRFFNFFTIKILVSLSTIISICLSDITFSQEDSNSEQQTVFVRRIVPSNYHQNNIDIEKMKNIISDSFQRSIKVKSGDSLSRILLDEYRVSESWTPQVYNQLLEFVKNNNRISNPNTDLKLGQMLKLPIIPKSSQTSKDRLLGNQPNVSLISDWNPESEMYERPPELVDLISNINKKEVQISEIPLSQIESINFPSASSNREDLFSEGHQHLLNLPVDVYFAAGESKINPFIIPHTEKDKLKTLFNKPIVTKPIVVILDDGWPSQADFQEAVKFVLTASKEIQNKFGLANPNGYDSSDYQTLVQERSRGTKFCPTENCEYPKLLTHSARIKKSLEPFTELDTENRVEVIYLPLNFSQTYSKQVLGEMMRIALVADNLVDTLVYQSGARKYPLGVERGVPVYGSVENILSSINKNSGLGLPKVASLGGDLKMRTDKAILDGVMNFLWLYSIASQRPYYLSLSWTSQKFKYSPLFRPQGYGLILAATGNDPNINVHSDSIEFADRSMDPGDIIAVQNSSGPSSKLKVDDDVPVLAFSFPGHIEDGMYGSSFSTPRVAWILALKESIKGKPIYPGVDGWSENWRAKQKSRLLRIIDGSASDEKRYVTTIWKLLEEPTP